MSWCHGVPLFGADLTKDRTVFVDEDFVPHGKQWSYLQSIRRTPRRLIIKICREFKPAINHGKPSNPVGEPIRIGARNKTLTSLAGAMRHKGATEAAMLAALLKENKERCEPPLPAKEVERIAVSVSKYSPGEGDGGRKVSQATKLVAALAPDSRLFHTSEQEPFITMRVNGHHETYRLRDLYIKRWLTRCFFERFGVAPSSQALRDALSLLEALALFKGPKKEVFTRLARRKGKIYVDLCNASWQAVEITPRGWKVISDPPVNFRRARGMKPLPLPVRGGSIRELRPFLNVDSEKDFVLCVGWLPH